MITLIFNNKADKAMELTTFNRNTTVVDGHMQSVVYISAISADYTAELIQNLLDDGVSAIEIRNGDDVIYSLADLEGKVTDVNDYLNEEHIITNINLVV